MKKLIIFTVCSCIITMFVLFHLHIKDQQHNYVVDKIKTSIKESLVLKNNLGDINDIYESDNEWFKEYKGNLFCKNFTIILDNKSAVEINVIVENKTLKIYGYEIDKNMIYEEDINEE